MGCSERNGAVMNYILIVLSIILGVMTGAVSKYAGERFKNKVLMYNVFNVFVSAVSAVSMLFIGKITHISAFTVYLGTAYGIATALQFIFNLKAYETGSFAYTSVITSLATVIPALSGYFIWNEKITIFQIIGMVMMFICAVCSVDFSKEERRTSAIWFCYTIIVFFCSGFLGVMQKLHQSTVYKNELDSFLFIAFVVSAVCSSASIVLPHRKNVGDNVDTLKKEVSKGLIVLMVICGIFTAGIHKINLYLSGVMESVVFFPVINGGSLMGTMMVSLLLFKEKLSLKKWVGIIIGIIAVILICTPV